MTARQEAMVRNFANDVGLTYLQVRGKLARELGVKEIRSKKHNLLAIKWDELDNAFVLTATGERIQLLNREL